MIVDLYAGPGGWSEALRSLDVPGEIGIEQDAAACATRAAAGHLTIRADIGTYPTGPFRGRARGLIASPPCPAFSGAGDKAGTALLPELVDLVRARRYDARPSEDPHVWLVVDLGRWIEDLAPEWIALEQVPEVGPVWRAYAANLEADGYRVWTGTLNAADYGVPQDRRRAILLAHRRRAVGPPPPTHSAGDSLFDQRWRTMGEALGLGRPAVLDRRQQGAPVLDPHSRPSPTLTTTAIGRTVWTLHVDSVRRMMTLADALAIQGFRPDYPVAGSRQKQHEQIGNAIPPGLARAVLAAVTK